MEHELLLRPFIYGLQIGVIYILVALGLTVILSIMNVLYLAHGEIYMIGAFAVYYLCSLLHINYIAALFISIVVVGLLGIVLERCFFRPIREAGIASTVIISIGLMWIFQSSAQILFGTESRGMLEVFRGGVSILGIGLSGSRIAAGLISIALLFGVYFFVYSTKQGRAMRAMAQDREAAALQGISIDIMSAIGFGLGCALAAAAGGIMAPILFIEPTMGIVVLVKSLAVIILGGVGSIPGVALGGLILGVTESYGHTFLGYPATTLPFAIMILVLVFKRTGLMGREV
jgi:branched-chain amino acid transport system permease protein